MSLQIENITKDIILVTSADKPISEYFIRFQEHFESPVFRNKVFTLGQFKSWYAKEYGAFTYHTDWSGFNIPSHILNPFIKGLFDPLTPEEQELLELFKYRTGKFYIIGVNEKHSLDHEICHGLWYTNETYRNKVKRVLDNYRTTSKFNEFYTALQADYNESVIEDEIHAYHAANDTKSRFERYIDLNLRQELREIRKDMGLLFEEDTEVKQQKVYEKLFEKAREDWDGDMDIWTVVTKSKPLKLEVGRRYRTRGGEILKHLELNEDIHTKTEYPFLGLTEGQFAGHTEGWRLTYTLDGFFRRPTCESVYDIVEEVKEEPKPLKLEVGKRYKTRDGCITGPLELNTNHDKKDRPFIVDINDHFWTFTESGRWKLNEEDLLDLIEEVKSSN